MIRVKSNTFIYVFFYMTIAITVFSQILIIKDFIVYPMYFMWLTFFGLLTIKNKCTIQFSRYFIAHLVIYTVTCIFSMIMLIYNVNYKLSGVFNILLLPIFIYIIGFWLARYLTMGILQKAVIVYSICAIFLGIQIFIKYISSLSVWLNSHIYLYEKKNSAGQIFISAAILLVVLIKPVKIYCIILKRGAIITLIFECMLVQCRTALLCFVIIIVFKIIIIDKSKKTIGAIMLIGIIMIFNKNFYDIILHAFFLDKYAGQGLNTMSSGRVYYIITALIEFTESPMVGVGNYYVDNLYICSLTELGLMFGLPIIFLWIYRIKLNIKLLELKNEFNAMMFYVTLYYFITSLLEAYPPFGPGASSFMFWLLCGIFDWKNKNKEDDK